MSTHRITLASLPTAAKLLLTLFLALVGFGYLAALGNLYHQFQMADGREGLTLEDLRVTFHGMEVTVEPDSSLQPAAAKSRMLEMVEPGGDMRKQVSKGGPEAIHALEQWLTRGALESEFRRAGLVQAGDPSAEQVIERYCLRCHNAADGEKSDTPYGPDLFTTDYEMVWKYAAPGTAKAASPAGDGQRPQPRRLGPSSVRHLFLITHIHMLSIPVFTLIVSGLFLLTGLRPVVKGILGPIPMLVLVLEFSSWWLARHSEPFIYLIAACGAVFGVTLALQLITVVASMWIRRPIDAIPLRR
ncbi:MAG: hypothetical protein V3W34_17195 [Phycisphaerae bacterium]